MTDSWIGGDFLGLQAMGTALTTTVAQLQDPVTILSSGADKLVSAAGWQGDAAKAFRGAWTDDAMTAGGFAELVGAVGQTFTDLGSALSSLNDALQSAAQTAQENGVALGYNGEPLDIATNNPPTASDTKALNSLNEYVKVRQAILYRGQQARTSAAAALDGYYADIDPDSGMATTDKFAFGIFLRDLYATRDDHKTKLAEKADEEVEKAEAAKDSAREALATELTALGDEGKTVITDLDSYPEFRSSISAFVKSEQALKDIESSRNAFSKGINFKLGDIDGLSEALSKLKWAPDFLADIPVVDVAAALGGSYFEAQQDHDEGWSWTHSIVVDTGGALLGVGAGVAIAAGLDAAPIALGTVAELGITVGSALLVGVGIDKAFHEHWSEDIHDNGVVGGLVHGSWDVAKGTYSSIKGDGKEVWHGITGLF